MGEMRKKIIIGIGIVLVVLMVVTLSNKNLDNQLTSASVFGQTDCITPQEAIKQINENGCEKISQDKKCAEEGLVEVRC